MDIYWLIPIGFILGVLGYIFKRPTKYITLKKKVSGGKKEWV